MDFHSIHGRQHGSIELKSNIADQILNIMNLTSSDIVLDVGSGDGYYTSRFSVQCKKVIAVDEYCEGFESEFYKKPNVEVLCKNACDWFIKAELSQITHVFFSNSFHDMDCQKEILSSLSQRLRVNAHIDMIEFFPDTPFGPPKSIRFSREALKSFVESYGFKEKSYLALNTHYFISFEK